MTLDEEYPKTNRRRTARMSQLLERVSRLRTPVREDIAMSLSQMSDAARDLDDIIDRLLNEPHTPAEIAELLIAFELTTEQLRGHSDTIDGKLYEIADRIKGVKPAVKAAGTGLRTRRAKAKA